MGLASKYSSQSLSKEDQKKVITTVGAPKRKPIGAINIEERVDAQLNGGKQPVDVSGIDADDDGDIPMVVIDDEDEVQVITDYVADTRKSLIKTEPSLAYTKMEEEINDLRPELPLLKPTYLVLDTNFILSHLNIVSALSALNQKYHHKIIIPTTVIKELDGLKGSERLSSEITEEISGKTVGYLARWANDWIYLKLADSNSAVRGQKLKEVLDHNSRKDDSILDCCLYFKEKEDALVILLSNDKNLCMKALANDILTVSYRKNMSAELIAKMAYDESCHRENDISPLSPPQRAGNPVEVPMDIDKSYDDGIVPESLNLDSPDALKTDPMISFTNTLEPLSSENGLFVDISGINDAANIIFKEVQTIMLGAVDNCMVEVYGDDLNLTDYEKDHIRTLKDCSNEMIKRWMAVFTEYFRQHNFKPFDSGPRGKKFPKYINVPHDAVELTHFTHYWTNVLRSLYINRDSTQKMALEKIIRRWNHILSSMNP